MAISRRNRRGITWLIVLVLLISLAPRLLSALIPDDQLKFSFEEIKKREAQLVVQNSRSKQSNKNDKKVKTYRIPESKFDPNGLLKQDWIDMGLSEKQADVIVKFTSHGISSNEDLKRIFVLPEKLFELIKDSTYYPAKQSDKVDVKQLKENKTILIELNSGTSESLQEVPGIGPYFGNKIVAYRNALGGFVSKEQLLEVYKMDSEKFDQMSPYLYVDAKLVSRIHINEVELDELKKHPYLNYKQANSIINYRTQHGPFQKVQDIMNSKLIDRELFEKLEPYLTTD